MAKKYEIQHDRPNCIGCSACAAINPKFWKMDDDGKSDVVGSSKDEKGWEHLDLDEEDFQSNKDAADSCPVNVIHIIKKDNKEKII